MIVFSSHEFREKTADLISRLRTTAKEIFSSNYDHNKVTKLLIEYGEFETAVSDQLKDSKSAPLLLRALRKAGKSTGDMCRKSVQKDTELLSSAREFMQTLSDIEQFTLPENVLTKIPEGYAYYGVYPEMYIHAAESFYTDYKPKKCIIIGIRSIGSSLSSVVWSAITISGIETYSFTVRPYGDPFNRKVDFQEFEKELILSNHDSYFLIVDEGPGLSGSSFAGTADELIKLGVPFQRIILFPSRMITGDELICEKAKYYWKNLDNRFIDFNEFWLQSGKFKNLTDGYEYEEISAGKWRDIFLKEESRYPAVFEQFERRKFIVRDENKKIRFFIKFGGLGKYGEWVFQNSIKFADAGFSPEVYKYDQGFIFYKYIENTKGYSYNLSKLMDFITEYLFYIENNFPAEPTYSFDEMKDMIYHNTKEALDPQLVNKIMNIKFDKSMFSTAVKNDGRMFPHEWIFNDRYFKTDNTEHYFDHLFPGSQDITWDIASFFTEFNLSNVQRRNFLDKYSTLSRNKYLEAKLRFIMLEYLAFRIGYCSFASNNSSYNAERIRFKKLAKCYTDMLYKETDAFN